jgi:lipoyl(octanoyl) transferase
MQLHVLPTRTANAAGNMAADFLLFRRYPEPGVARYRHYTWQRPAFTFGYSQKIAFVRERLPKDEPLDVTRRSTGGGIVDHREDWTYALALPREHPLWDRPGPTIYRTVHQALAQALSSLGADVRLQQLQTEAAPGVCFERPELDDVVSASDGRKVAGAALKRAKFGVLLQGSVWKPFAPAVDWDSLEETLPRAVAAALELEPVSRGWPEIDPEEEQALIDQYASSDWIEAR